MLLDTHTESFPIKSDTVSYLLPTQFEERILRVYSKSGSTEKLLAVQVCGGIRWCLSTRVPPFPHSLAGWRGVHRKRFVSSCGSTRRCHPARLPHHECGRHQTGEDGLQTAQVA